MVCKRFCNSTLQNRVVLPKKNVSKYLHRSWSIDIYWFKTDLKLITIINDVHTSPGPNQATEMLTKIMRDWIQKTIHHKSRIKENKKGQTSKNKSSKQTNE